MVDQLRSSQEFVSPQTFGRVIDHIVSEGFLVGETFPWGGPSEYADGPVDRATIREPQDLKDSSQDKIQIFDEDGGRIAILDISGARWKITTYGTDNSKARRLGVTLIDSFNKQLDLNALGTPIEHGIEGRLEMLKRSFMEELFSRL